MSTPQNDMDADESSGVTTLRPVPVKPARLLDLSESDSTQYFSATELLERGKLLAAQASQPSPPSIQQVLSTLETAPSRAGWLAQFRQASLPRKAVAILLPLLSVVLLAKPMLENAERPTPSKPHASVAAAVPAPLKLAAPAPAASVALPALARGITVAHAAADSVATGDFARAAALYRELSRRDPSNQAYGVAARILSERARTQRP